MSTITKTTDLRFPNWLRYLEKYFEGMVALALLMVVLGITIVDIFGRAAFAWTIDWGFEVAQGLFVWIAWLAASFGLRHQSYFRFTLFRAKLSNRGQYAMYAIEWLLWLLVIGAIFLYSIPEFLQILDSGRIVVGTENVLQAHLYLAVPVGTGMILLRVVQQAVTTTVAYRNGDDITPDPRIGVRDE
ncbi:TRAP transporter small permease [Natronococcus pandeyae]|uniref:TRAP transporter small permease n=1 Tax=Natronococcus pandeyae TaxID=2055836 RepID=A0A8J8TQK4_9EURY|nr:TRAP transporter small permease subunit [Natronococcus pandeyae]TYL36789.1 TRAP transporter small permease [Natronococcus pandeyae]